MSENPRVPLSVLDLAVVPAGGTGAEAVRAAVDLAVDLDRLGYRRVWYAEHHLSPGVGSASPAVLAAAVTAALQGAFDDGSYQQVLERWGLEDEAIDAPETNPPGLPKTS